MEQKTHLPVCLRLGPGRPLFTDTRRCPQRAGQGPRPNPQHAGQALPPRWGVGSAFLTLHLLEAQAATSSGAPGPTPGRALTTLIWSGHPTEPTMEATAGLGHTVQFLLRSSHSGFTPDQISKLS